MYFRGGGDSTEVDHHCTPKEAFEFFTENDLSCNLRVLGCQLGLKPSDLDTLLPPDLSRPPYQELLFYILSKCSEKELLSWIKLIVLRKPALKLYRIANKICTTYRIATGSSESDSIASLLSPRSGSLERSLTFMYSLSEDSAEPEISEVVNEIADVKDWEQLAISLGLTASDINLIK